MFKLIYDVASCALRLSTSPATGHWIVHRATNPPCHHRHPASPTLLCATLVRILSTSVPQRFVVLFFSFNCVLIFVPYHPSPMHAAPPTLSRTTCSTCIALPMLPNHPHHWLLKCTSGMFFSFNFFSNLMELRLGARDADLWWEWPRMRERIWMGQVWTCRLHRAASDASYFAVWVVRDVCCASLVL